MATGLAKRDGVIGYFDGLRADYNAVKSSRHKRRVTNLPRQGANADYHFHSESQYLAIMEMVRDFERNDPIVRAAFNRLVSNIVRTGFTLDVNTGDTEVDKHLQEKWETWSNEADHCDATGELTFSEMEGKALRSVIRDGDVCAVPLSSGHLKWYEAHRLRTPKGTSKNVVLGVLLDEQRRRREYWFTKEDIKPWRTVSLVREMVQIAARDDMGNRQVLHLYHGERFNQTRGVSWCVPAVDTIGMHDDIQFAKMVQQKVVSCYSVFRKRSSEWKPELAAAGGDGAAALSRNEYLYGMQRSLQQLFPGQIIDGMPGEELQGFSPNVPNPEFFHHAFLLLSFIAANLDLPLQVLLLDPTKTNFSGWRGAIDQARLRFTELQDWFKKRFHRRVYAWKVRQWLAEDTILQDALRGGMNVFGHDWHPPSWQYIEPLKDAQADELIIRSGLDSRRAVQAKSGKNYDQTMAAVFAELEFELDRCCEIADRLNTKWQGKRVGKPFDVRELAQARGILPTGSNTSLSGSLDEEETSGSELVLTGGTDD